MKSNPNCLSRYRSKVHVASLPQTSALSPIYQHANLADAFAIVVPSRDRANARSWAAAILGHPKPWIRILLKIRDTMAVLAGIRTSSSLKRKAEYNGHDHIAFFRIHSGTEIEIILGEDDRHLNFRISILVRERADDLSLEITATTVVQCNNTLGRMYLAIIKPFHRAVMMSNLSNASHWISNS